MRLAHGDLSPTTALPYPRKDCLHNFKATDQPKTDQDEEKETKTVEKECPNLDEQNVTGQMSAAFLIITHILELVTMLAITVLRLISNKSSNNSISSRISQMTYLESSVKIPNSELPYVVLLCLHISFLVCPLVILSALSFVWTLKSQDFNGRSAARIVCWVLHFFQASLIWRYLKIQLAYDPSDVAELGTLRFAQVHFHTLPFLVLHTILTLLSPKSYLVSLGLGLTLLLSSVITIIIATTVRKLPHHTSLSLPTISQVVDCTPNTQVNIKEDTSAKIIVGMTTGCVLYCRITSIASLFCLHVVWATVLILIHWMIAFAWVCIQEDIQAIAMNDTKKWVRRSFLAYLLVWDYHVFREDASALNICAKPKLPATFYLIVTTQNMTIMSSCFFISSNISFTVCLATISSVSLLQFTSLVLLTLSYLYYTSILPNWSQNIACLGDEKKSVTYDEQQISSTNMKSIAEQTNEGISSSYIDFKEIEGSDIIRTHEKNKLQEQSPSVKPHLSAIYKSSLTPHLLKQDLAPSMFSFSSDILPSTSKSERSSLENGSFNSRNTNTIPQTTHGVENDTVHKTRGSVSDSFSSLSCGTTHKNVYSSLKYRNSKQFSLYSHSRIKRHASCQNGSCHCKIFDVVGHNCGQGVEEEDIKEEEQIKNEVLSTKSSNLGVSVVKGPQFFRVICSACHYPHDPLLSKCLSNCQLKSSKLSSQVHENNYGGGSSTDYPSDTEITATLDTLSTISADSHSTYTTWPVGRGPGFARWLTKDKENDYVTAWLKHQQTRGMSNGTHSTKVRTKRIHGKQRQRRFSKTIVQNLETVV